MIVVRLPLSSVFWYSTDVVGPYNTPESYAANPFVITSYFVGRVNYIVDLTDALEEPLPYDVIYGKTVNELRALIGGEGGYAPLTVKVTPGFRSIIQGTELAETIIGNSGDNFIIDGQEDGPAPNGPDMLYGGAGGDLYVLYSNQTQVLEYRIADDGTVTTEDAGGLDSVSVRSGDYVMPEFVEALILSNGSSATGNASNNSIIGGSNAETILGLDGNDELVAGGGNDVVDGGRGDDILAGYGGDDVLTGGEGGDLFFFDRDQNGRDTITDFGEQDVLVTRHAIRDANGDGLITFSANDRLDLARRASVSINDTSGDQVTALEYDGYFDSPYFRLYVYSLAGSPANVDTAASFDLNGTLVNLT